VTFNRN